MGKTLADIDRMSALEFEEWRQYDALFPFGDVRADWRMGTIASMIFNVNRGKGAPQMNADDFVLKPPKTQKQRETGFRAMMKSRSKGSK